MLFGFAVSRTKDEGLAKDLVQETFVKAFENADQLKEASQLKSWLFKVLRNKIIDHYRSLAARMNKKTVELDYSVYFDQSEMWQMDKMPGDWLATYDVKKEEDFKHLKSTLEECIDHLKEMPAAVIKLKYMDEVKSGEICKLLNISSSNYWVIVHRAKLKLRDCMEKMLPRL
jgi:RNA polymerase sigma-70 factor (TIGR02943 family)